jgi:hypothetical protein
VGRVWWPERKRRFELDAGALDIPDLGFFDDAFALIGILLLAIFLVPFLFVLILPLLELGLILMIALLGVAGRMVLRRPWTVRARAQDREPIRRRVSGWRNSLELKRELAAAIRDGRPPPL